MNLQEVTSLVQGEHGDLVLKGVGYLAAFLGVSWLGFKAVALSVAGAKMATSFAVRTALGALAAIPFTAMVTLGGLSGGASIFGYGVGELRTGNAAQESVTNAVVIEPGKLYAMATDKDAHPEKLQAIFAYAKEANEAIAKQSISSYKPMPLAPEQVGSSRVGWSAIFGGMGMFLCSLIMLVDKVGKDGNLLK